MYQAVDTSRVQSTQKYRNYAALFIQFHVLVSNPSHTNVIDISIRFCLSHKFTNDHQSVLINVLYIVCGTCMYHNKPRPQHPSLVSKSVHRARITSSIVKIQ